MTYGLTLAETLLFELWWNSSDLTPLLPALNFTVRGLLLPTMTAFQGTALKSFFVNEDISGSFFSLSLTVCSASSPLLSPHLV